MQISGGQLTGVRVCVTSKSCDVLHCPVAQMIRAPAAAHVEEVVQEVICLIPMSDTFLLSAGRLERRGRERLRCEFKS